MGDMVRRWHSLLHSRETDTVMVKLGASTTLMRWLVPQIVLQVKKEYPHIYFDLYESFVEQVFRTVVDKRMPGLITCVNERVESSYRIQLLQNDMEAEVGPEDGCVVVLNRKHPLASLPRLALRHLAELRMAWNPQRDRFFVYRDICKYFSPAGIIAYSRTGKSSAPHLHGERHCGSIAPQRSAGTGRLGAQSARHGCGGFSHARPRYGLSIPAGRVLPKAWCWRPFAER